MIYITGDCHGDFRRFSTNIFVEQKQMTKNDYVIICGDFGGLWHQKKNKEENYWLDWLNDKPFTTLFVSGNHENFDRMNQLPIEDWKGGKIQKVHSSIYHLMRGEIFNIDGYKIFTFGGARSHDIQDGIIEMDNGWKKKANRWYREGKMFRINHFSWWKEEMPSEEEMNYGLKNLQENNNKVDFIISHCLYSSFVKDIGSGLYETDYLTDYFEKIKERIEYRKWFCGHYHINRAINDKDIVLYEQIIRIA